MNYRNKTYIAFDADTDIRSYFLMKAWKSNSSIPFNFNDAHDLNNLRTDNEVQIKRKLRERLNNSKLMFILIGLNTKNLYKFVRWEMEVAIELGIPIVAVNLNNKKNRDLNLCPPIIRDELVLHIPFKLKAIQWASDYWVNKYNQYLAQGKSGPYQLDISY